MKTGKKWFIAAAFAILIGLVIFGGAMAMSGWDFSKLSTRRFETNEYTVGDSFSGICAEICTADIKILPSEDGAVRVVCFEEKNVKHTVAVDNGTLTIKVQDARKWYEHIGINFKTASVKIYVPEGDYGALAICSTTGDVSVSDSFSFESINITATTGDVQCYADTDGDCNITLTTGDVCVKGVSAKALNISTSTGDVEVNDVELSGDADVEVTTGRVKLTALAARDVAVETDTGDVTLTGLIASGKLSVDTDTGDVRLDMSDAAEIFIETDTGDVVGSLLTDKIFITKTDTGRVDVPKSVSGGRCEITTDTGNIIITISERER